MFEIDNPLSRADFLSKVGGIEEKVYIQINGEKIIAKPEADLDRTSAEGKASSVQFLHFDFSDAQIEIFKNINNKVLLGIDHSLYNHMTTISKDVKESLISDFS